MSWWEVIIDAIIDAIYRIFGYRKVTATSVLETKGGALIAGGPITLSYKPYLSATFTQDGTGVTDQEGTATENVHLRRGTYTFRVDFPGSALYGPSSAETGAVNV